MASDSTNLSLLQRVGRGYPLAWERFTAIYRPMIQRWFQGHGVALAEAEDLTQDILVVLVKALPDFKHAGRKGSFRSWLRTVTVNRARKFWQANKMRFPSGQFPDLLDSLVDPKSELSQQWDIEHDRAVHHRLLEIVDRDFEPESARVFRRMVIDGVSGPDVAGEFGLSVAAVYGVKARILKRLREEALGLLEFDE